MAKKQRRIGKERNYAESISRGSKHDVGLVISVLIIVVLLFFLLSS